MTSPGAADLEQISGVAGTKWIANEALGRNPHQA
jgi:hypothetical protein